MSLGFHTRVSTIASILLSTSVLVTGVQADQSSYLQTGDGALQHGRELWMENCEGCHGYGIADAPIPMRPGDWKRRVTKDREVLYSHAIDGFIGEDYSMMPARGGNEELSDEQVKAAVDYMLFLANFYIKRQTKQ